MPSLGELRPYFDSLGEVRLNFESLGEVRLYFESRGEVRLNFESRGDIIRPFLASRGDIWRESRLDRFSAGGKHADRDKSCMDTDVVSAYLVTGEEKGVILELMPWLVCGCAWVLLVEFACLLDDFAVDWESSRGDVFCVSELDVASCVYMYVYVCICMYMYVYVCIYVCICVLSMYL
jgi:hypothetical protein